MSIQSVYLAVVVVALSLSTACLPVIWALPPTQVEVGGGVISEDTDSGVTAILPMGAGVYPLQFPVDSHDRKFDAGLGYRGVLNFSQPFGYHGPYMEVGYLHSTAYDGIFTGYGDSIMRLGIAARTSYLFGTHLERAGFTAGLRITLEFTSFVDVGGAECEADVNDAGDVFWYCGAMVGYGENSWGLYAEGTRGVTMSPVITGIVAGFYIRIPSSAGMGFFGGF